MKILFLNPPSPAGVNVYRDNLAGFGVAEPSKRERYGHEAHVIPPLFFAYAAAILEKREFEVAILDGQVRDLDLQSLLREVEKQDPDIIITRVSLPCFKEDLKVIASIREILPKVVLAGWGAVCTVMPQEALVNSALNTVVRDELEFTLPPMIEKLETGEGLYSVQGVSFIQNGKVIHNPQRPFVKNLDVLPSPAYHLLDMEKYVVRESIFFPKTKRGGRTRFFSVLSSRGCSFNCKYCPYPAIFGPWRGISAKKTVDEIEHLVNNYGVEGIWFRDATFSMSVKRAIRICDEIIRRDLDVRWLCETRAEKMPRHLLRKMKRAGCIWVQVGVETGDERLLRTMVKGSSLQKIEQAFRIAKEEEIMRTAFVLVGFPGESWKTIKKTRALIKRIKPDELYVSIATPYFGTPLHEMAKHNNWLITNDYKKYTSNDPVMSLPGFNHKDMVHARDYLMDQAKIREFTTAFRNFRLKKVAKKIGGTILHLPHTSKHLYNLIRCGLR